MLIGFWTQENIFFQAEIEYVSHKQTKKNFSPPSKINKYPVDLEIIFLFVTMKIPTKLFQVHLP